MDSVVAIAAALVNVATPGDRQGRPYPVPVGDERRDALVAALQLGRRRVTDETIDEPGLLALAQAARPVFVASDAGDGDAAAASVNALLTCYRPTPTLAQHDDEPWHLHFHGPARSDPSGWGGGVAVALATVIGSEYADRLGVCAAPTCDRVFVDVSRNGTRRFCSETCQNRVKVAAHRARQQAP
ncbi:MAG TPA: CGNR zinc finger domain-containing protein [Mycobacterium sp.]